MTPNKNLENREGYRNRHIDPLPSSETDIVVITKDYSGEHIDYCRWMPFKKEDYSPENMPSKGYLGTATVISGEFKGIGFHAWEQNNSEFIYYRIPQS